MPQAIKLKGYWKSRRDGPMSYIEGKMSGRLKSGGRDNHVGCVESTRNLTGRSGKSPFLWDETTIMRLACDVLKGSQIINPRWRERAEWFRAKGAHNPTQKWRELK